MKIIKNETPNFQKTVQVEMTIAEAAALAATIGEFNSSDVSDMVESDYGNQELTLATEGLGQKLYDVLDELVTEELL